LVVPSIYLFFEDLAGLKRRLSGMESTEATGSPG